MPFTVLSLIYWLPTPRSWKLFEAKSFAVFLTIQYELYMFVTNFPFKRSWWAILLSVTEGLKEGWKEMFLTAWKGLHNFCHSYWLAPLHFSELMTIIKTNFNDLITGTLLLLRALFTLLRESQHQWCAKNRWGVDWLAAFM